MAVTGKTEREQHDGIYRNAVGRKSDRHITDRPCQITHITFLVTYNEFLDLGEEQQRHQSMRQLLCVQAPNEQYLATVQHGSLLRAKLNKKPLDIVHHLC